MANYNGKLQVAEFRASDLLNKGAKEKLIDEFIMSLCQTAVLSFFDDDTDEVTAWLQAHAYIIDLQDAGTVDVKGALQLSMFATTYMNNKTNQEKGVNDNGKSERRRNVNCGRNTCGNGTSRKRKGDGDDYDE